MDSTSVIQQKGLPKDSFVLIKEDSLVSQKWGETPRSHNPDVKQRPKTGRMRRNITPDRIRRKGLPKCLSQTPRQAHKMESL